MKKLLKDFKDFVNRGNVMDLAVAVVMGAAFTAIINAVVGDLVTPLISFITFGVDFSSLGLTVGEGNDAAVLKYGSLIQSILNFLITALVIFFLIKGINALSRKPVLGQAPPTMSCPYCSTQIPDSAVRCPNCTTILDASKVPKDVR
ncbi:MAG: large conductance mechanosensitive channel protein MscL [Coriobacteriales bacterium]|jgi:large conductance mechanosensitive channel|nr:large conductance mechanosensitive channel protein MscL [Coriobacteriales bacterium]